jgi:hypothetical protein
MVNRYGPASELSFVGFVSLQKIVLFHTVKDGILDAQDLAEDADTQRT